MCKEMNFTNSGNKLKITCDGFGTHQKFRGTPPFIEAQFSSFWVRAILSNWLLTNKMLGKMDSYIYIMNDIVTSILLTLSWITLSGGSQLMCSQGTQVALQSGPRGQELKPVANSYYGTEDTSCEDTMMKMDPPILADTLPATS